MTIGIIVAMDSEYQMLQSISLEQKKQGEASIVVSRAGIGKVNAALTTARMIAHSSPSCIISTGVAGGLDSTLNVGDIVVSSEVCYHDVWCGQGNELGQVQGLPPRFAANTALVSTARKAVTSNQEGQRLHVGLICTGDRFITSAEELRAIKGNFSDALAVDMESAAIAHTCHLRNVPFMSMRVISDTPGNTDNHALQYENFWQSLAQTSFRAINRIVEQLRTNNPLFDI